MLTIIIPTYNEADNIAKTIKAIGDLTGNEVIVVDGGSSDQTTNIAKNMGVKVLSSQPGRARQMNLGVQESSGDTLLFLHGDTILPADFSDNLKAVLAKPGVVVGAFKLRIGMAGVGARIIEKLVDWRSRFLQMPYGDQAIFMERSLFSEVGCYDNEPFLEDYLFIRKARKYGRIGLSEAAVQTSGRRWQRLGLIRTTIINQLVIAGFLFGVPIVKLKKLYGIVKKG